MHRITSFFPLWGGGGEGTGITTILCQAASVILIKANLIFFPNFSKVFSNYLALRKRPWKFINKWNNNGNIWLPDQTKMSNLLFSINNVGYWCLEYCQAPESVCTYSEECQAKLIKAIQALQDKPLINSDTDAEAS